jgi:hypothetical protein
MAIGSLAGNVSSSASSSSSSRLFAEKFMKPAAVEGFGLDTFV